MSDSSVTLVELGVANHVATITLNRPARLNAIDLPMAEALLREIRAVGAEADVHAIVISGRGRAFSAGGDLVAIGELIDRGDWGAARRLLELGRDIVVTLRTMPKAVIAAVNGPAMGAGASLALACDMRIASGEAVFGLPFTRLGLHPDWGACYFLPRIVGAGRATELILSGRTIDAVEAERLGLFHLTVPATGLLDEAHRLAASLTQLPAEAVILAKRTVEESFHSTLEHLLEIEVQRQLHCLQTATARQAISAFTSRPAGG
jgi:2-(1,2-epoxy-1,2-dihydrophenyl)acetyl-CoA isomerase